MKADRTISGRVLILLTNGLYWPSLTWKVVLKTYIERNLEVIRNLRLFEWGWVWCEELCRLRRMFGPHWITWSFKDLRGSLSSSIWRIPGGYSWDFLVGMCCPVLQILILFRTKKCHFPHPFSDQTSKTILVFRSGTRFSKVPLTFRARNEIFKSKYKE